MMMNRRNSQANMFGILSETPKYEQIAKKSFVPRIYSKKELQMKEKYQPSLPYKSVISTLPKHMKWQLPVSVYTMSSPVDGSYIETMDTSVPFDDNYDPLPEDFDRMHYIDRINEFKEPEYDGPQYETGEEDSYDRYEQEYDDYHNDYHEYDQYDKYENDYFD